MTNQDIIAKSREHLFSIGQYKFLSQHPNVLSEHHRSFVVPAFLPQFLQIWHDIEKVTGYRWRMTSYLRQSPSHRRGHAIDLAPWIAPEARSYYAVYNNSDPVLYKRAPLIRALQQLKNIDYSKNRFNDMGIFIEPDHLHIQVLAPNFQGNPTSVVKWGIPKPVYHDTYQRLKLPVTDKGYPGRNK